MNKQVNPNLKAILEFIENNLFVFIIALLFLVGIIEELIRKM